VRLSAHTLGGIQVLLRRFDSNSKLDSTVLLVIVTTIAICYLIELFLDGIFDGMIPEFPDLALAIVLAVPIGLITFSLAKFIRAGGDLYSRSLRYLGALFGLALLIGGGIRFIPDQSVVTSWSLVLMLPPSILLSILGLQLGGRGHC